LLILFQPLNATGIDMSQSAKRQTEWKASKEMLSCVQPDLEQMLWEGKLDREAIADWCDFMNNAVKDTYSRNANLWAFLGYYMCNLEVLSRGEDELPTVFEFLCKSLVRQYAMSTKHSSTMHQFVIAIHTCRTACAANPLTAEEKAIHWHSKQGEVKR
jgi:hypothetical protein